MSRIVISHAARLDRREITAYTAEQFGVDSARRLRRRFEAVLNALADSPLIGRACKSLDPPGRTFRYLLVARTFIVVYEPLKGGIRVARILHGSRNLAAELQREAGEDE
ncbi:MAG TPA: type II toxin-antitoxin system RelE/ParE family toxin [Planctomycetota bacterium]|nr:type II toxin-antitoxin system RelE/ParE family toxin [Planctomycetota bacterium]